MFSTTELMTFSNSEQSFFEDNLLDADDWGKGNVLDITDFDASPSSSSSSTDSEQLNDISSTWLMDTDTDIWLQEELENYASHYDLALKPESTDDICIKQEPLSLNSYVPLTTASTLNVQPVTTVTMTANSITSLTLNQNINTKLSNYIPPVTSNNKSLKLSSPSLVNSVSNSQNINMSNIRNLKAAAAKREPTSKILIHSSGINAFVPNQGKLKTSITPQATRMFSSPQMIKLENGQYYVAKSVTKPNLQTNCNNITKPSLPANYNDSMQKPILKRPSNIKIENLLPPPQDLNELKNYKRQQRMMKNRESACLSRQRKKQHLNGLEEQVSVVYALNQSLKEENENLKERIQALESENCKLRKLPTSNSQFKDNAKKSSVVFAILLLFIFNPYRYVPDTSSNTSQDPIISLPVIHRSRSLLQFDNSNINNYNDVYNINKFGSHKLNPSMKLNMDKKKIFQRNQKIKRQQKSVPVSKYRYHQSSQHTSIVSENDVDCGEQFNKTDLSRINRALEGLVKELHKEKKKKIKFRFNPRNIFLSNSTSDKNLIKKTVAANCNQSEQQSKPVASPYVKFRRYEKSKKAIGSNKLFVATNTSQELASVIQKSISRKSDTFYVISLLKDYLILPATSFNNTQRPKLSFLLPAFNPSNDSTWKETGKLPMIQIDCNVLDTKVIDLHRDSISKNLLAQLKSS